MDIRLERSWMYNRLNPGRKGLTEEFLIGVEHFIVVASQLPSFISEGKIRCPCSRHKNTAYLTVDEVKVDLYKKGFLPNYWYWTCHGEFEPHVDIEACPSSRNEGDFSGYEFGGQYEELIHDVAQAAFVGQPIEEQPNVEAQRFFDLLKAAERPLWEGCTSHTELSVAVRMLSIKTQFNVPREAFDQFANLMKETNPQQNLVPDDLYRTKKLVSKLGLKSEKIDCCINNCMLFYKQFSEELQCRHCGASRFKPPSRKQRKSIPQKRLFYLPITSRLQRLYTSMRSAKHMRWHHSRSIGSETLCHPADGEAWQHFNRCYPDFAAEPRNVRLALCSDGFTPYSQSASPYSCWPVMLTPYNLPPEMCMTTPYIFLTLIIPGPHNPKAKIDVFMQPLIDELKMLWEVGVLTYDISTKQNFQLKAALMWTINDFPAYGMLSGWSTAGKLACPYCMDLSKAFYLQNGRKNSWFDCHRMFLPHNHPFRRNREAFMKNKVEKSTPPPRLTGEDVSSIVSSLPYITDSPSLSDTRVTGYGVHHNWIKKSIFWELPYWKSNLIRHNIDVMHTEKNFFDNIFNTVMDVHGKTKDNVNARLDLAELCRRRELELIETATGKFVKPKAKYCLTLDERRAVCEWVQSLRFPYGYASNLSRCVDVRNGRLFGLKSHDCHIFLQCLLPVAFSMLPEQILNPLIEISLFFKELSSSTLTKDGLRNLEANIPVILCKLERIFPPSFFDSMEHLSIHLPYEARVGGPVQYRWMYPFERFLNKLKKTVKNKAHPEGSICEAYLAQETTTFCSYYFNNDNVRDNTDEVQNQGNVLSIFRSSGKALGRSSSRYLSDKEMKAATLNVLINCDEVQPFLEIFTNCLTVTNEAAISKMIEDEFPVWFRNYVHEQVNDITDENIRDLAWGPSRSVRTWNMYDVNGYRFHTNSWAEGKKTYNAGVSVRGNAHDENGVDYYGILQEIVELQYPGLNERNVILFSCEWFDPILNRGTRKHKTYNLTEVKLSRRYAKFDPFIMSDQAKQVYYLRYPGRIRDKVDWAVVVKIKPRAIIEVENNIELAHQEEEMNTIAITMIDETPVGSLIDENAELQEVDQIEEENTSDEDESESSISSSSSSTESS